MRRLVFSTVVLQLLVAGNVAGDPIIDVGDHTLLADTAGQVIAIYVSGGELVEGTNFYVQVADGGSEAADLGAIPPPGIDGPHITAVDLVNGTIFDGNNLGQVDTGANELIPQFFNSFIVTDTGPATTSGLLATVTIDTTGFLSGTWDLSVGDTLDGATNFLISVGGEISEIPAQITDGTITIEAAVAGFQTIANGNWNHPATWDQGGLVPTECCNAIVRNHTVNVAAAAGAASLLLNHQRSELLVGAGNTLSVTGDAEIANGKVDIASAGWLDVGGAVEVGAPAEIAGDGFLTAGGGITNHGLIDLGDDSLHIMGATLDNQGVVRGGGRIDNRLQNGTAGEVRVGDGQSMVLFGPGNTNAGRIEVIGGEIEFTRGLVNEAAGGTLAASDARLRFGSGLANSGSFGITFGTTHVFGDVTNDGTIVASGNSEVTFYDDVINDGELKVSEGCAAVFFGSFTGSQGTTGGGTVFIEGDLRPGHSPATISFGGDLVFGSSAMLEAELDGPIHDRIDVAGDVYVDGTLTTGMLEPLELEPGTSASLTLVTAAGPGGIVGTFDGEPAPGDHLGEGIFVTDHGANGQAVAYVGTPVVTAVDLDVLQAIAGDVDGDADIDGDDIQMILAADAFPRKRPADWTTGDFNADGLCDGDDIQLILATNLFGQGSYTASLPAAEAGLQAAPVPEPSTLILLVAATLAVLVYARRKHGH